MIRHVSTAAVATLLFVWSETAIAGGRIALAIGNSNYRDIHIPLRTPRNDAQDVAGALQQLGFEVDLSLDANKKSMDAAFARFARAATNAESALFFYAGHSVEFRGENYLVPTDAELKDEVSVLYEMVSIENLRAALDHIKGVRIMIVDACRDNPLAEKLQNSPQDRLVCPCAELRTSSRAKER